MLIANATAGKLPVVVMHSSVDMYSSVDISSVDSSGADVDMVLGCVQEDRLRQFLLSCFRNDRQESLTILKSFLDDGVNVFQLYDDILNYLKCDLFELESSSFDNGRNISSPKDNFVP